MIIIHQLQEMYNILQPKIYHQKQMNSHTLIISNLKIAELHEQTGHQLQKREIAYSNTIHHGNILTMKKHYSK